MTFGKSQARSEKNEPVHLLSAEDKYARLVVTRRNFSLLASIIHTHIYMHIYIYIYIYTYYTFIFIWEKCLLYRR